MGDSPAIDLRASNPLHLLEVVADNELREARIVLLHSGYPYVREAGYLANSYQNVYVDLSEMIPFASIGAKTCILQLLEMAPVTKLMYGSDGFGVPEIFWIGGLIGKEALAAALQELIERRAIDEDYAHSAARQILQGNALRLYRLTLNRVRCGMICGKSCVPQLSGKIKIMYSAEDKVRMVKNNEHFSRGGACNIPCFGVPALIGCGAIYACRHIVVGPFFAVDGQLEFKAQRLVVTVLVGVGAIDGRDRRTFELRSSFNLR